MVVEQPERPDHISQEDWDAVDLPEMTEQEMARAVPFAEIFPAQARALERQGGRPRVDHPKVKVAWRLSADVVDHIKRIGKGSTARVDAILKDAIAKGVL